MRVSFNVFASVLAIGFLLAFVSVAILFVMTVYKFKTFYFHTNRIELVVEGMRDRKPADIDQELWGEACDWLCTANGNICYSPESMPTEIVKDLAWRFESRGEGEVDLNTVEWMWDQFAGTGPAGAHYARRHRACYLVDVQRKQPELLNDAMREQIRAQAEYYEQN